MTTIEWTHRPGTKGETWNPVAGCTILSPGCTHCYAMKMAARIEAINAAAGRDTHYAGTTKPSKAGPVWTGAVNIAPDHILTAPLRWKSPRTVFVNSMSDLFHEEVPDETIDRVFAIMALTPQHTYQILTKRSARMRAYVAALAGEDMDARLDRQTRLMRAARKMAPLPPPFTMQITGPILHEGGPQQILAHHGMEHRALHARTWPLPNVWLGVSAERQQEAVARVPDLLATPAAIRFVSAEPLLGEIDFTKVVLRGDGKMPTELSKVLGDYVLPLDGNFTDSAKLDQIIVGGESGPDARPMHPAWARSIRDQCAAAGVPFFFKQWGAHRPLTLAEHGQACGATLIGDDPHDRDAYVLRVGKSRAGRLLDGVEHNEWPAPHAPHLDLPHPEPVEGRTP